MSDDHLANVLGAVALAVSDQMVERRRNAAGQAESEVAALTSLEQFMPRFSPVRLVDPRRTWI